MKVTIFTSKKTLSKVPTSPYDNNQFEFETKDVNTIEDVYDYLKSYFVLNIPLSRSIKTYRRKKNLQDYFVQKLDYLVLDIDKIKTISDKELCIKFFKDKNYECILGESRNPLNLKGVLRVNCTQKESKSIVKEINEELNGYGNFDLTVTNFATYQAPTLKRTVYFKNLNSRVYPTPYQPIQEKIEIKKIEVSESIQELCKKEFMNLGFRFHEKQNDFFTVSHYSEKKSPKGFRWYPDNPFKVHHWNADRNINVWDKVTKTPEYKDFIYKRDKKKIKEIIVQKEPNVNQRYLGKYSDQVKEFLNNKNILKVQSPMGTGKSSIIQEIIEQSENNGLRILFITNRISLADDISKKYNNIKHYLGTEVEGNNYEVGDNLVVQIDSLWKYSTKYFDVVILDEFGTLINQVLSLEQESKPQKKNIITKFFSLKKKKISILDAIILDSHLELFGKKDETIEIINGYRDETEIQFFTHKDNFIYNLIQDAKTEHLSFSSGSLSIINVVKLLLDQNDVSYKVISGETSKEERELIYKSFLNKKPLAQVIIYSPTITVGISILNEINTHYHYDSGDSVNVLSSLQMIKRTRKAQIIKMYLNSRQKYLCTDKIEIENTLKDYSKTDDDGDVIGIEDQGSKLSEIIRTNNILENLHKDSFLSLMRFQFNMKNIKVIKDTVQPFVQKTSKVVKEIEKKKNLNVFETYLQMSDEQITDIEMKAWGTNKEEILIKRFLLLKEDPLLQMLTQNSLNDLIEEDLRTPGIIDSYKELITDFGYDYKDKVKSVLIKKKFKNKENEFKKYGYFKDRNRLYLNRVLLKIDYKGK